ncbi:hypothetical protein D9M71_660000 [compost metagenome]
MKPEWEEAPEWAQVLVKQNVSTGIRYCWAAGYSDGAIARWVVDADYLQFNLRRDCWELVEGRP